MITTTTITLDENGEATEETVTEIVESEEVEVEESEEEEEPVQEEEPSQDAEEPTQEEEELAEEEQDMSAPEVWCLSFIIIIVGNYLQNHHATSKDTLQHTLQII